MSIVRYLVEQVASCVGATDLGDGAFDLRMQGGSRRQATVAEILGARKADRLDAINAECRARLLARYGPAEEQVSRSIGVYGAQEQADMQAGIAATIAASNTAANAVLAAADIAAVEAVSVSWPAI